MKTDAKIIELLQENGPMQPYALWYKTGVKLGTMTATVARLITDKKIKEIAKDGQIYLTLIPAPKGKID